MHQRKERLLHHVSVSVFAKPHEDRDEVLGGLDALSPVPTAELLALDPEHDPERPHTVHYRAPDTTLTVQELPSDEGVMVIYTLFFRKIGAVNEFARKLRACMTPHEVAAYVQDPSSLLDAHEKLSVRLDKELLMQGQLSITDDGQCYQVKASIAAYPKNRERIIAGVHRLLGHRQTSL